MAEEIVVPQVGEAVDEVLLVRWFKQEGEPVTKGETLFEVDTDKVTVEVEAFADGVLQQILVPEGSGVMPQQVVGLLATEASPPTPPPFQGRGESTPTPSPSPVPGEGKGSSESSFVGQTEEGRNGRVTPVAQRVAAALGLQPGGLAGSGPGGRVTAEDVRRSASTLAPAVSQPARVLASPRARRLAAEWGVELAGLSGTGVDGLIRTRDVEAARPVAPVSQPAQTGESRPLSRLRQAIAANTQASKQTVPHFYLSADVDMGQVQSLRAYCTETLGWAKAPTYTDVLVRACGLALAALPECNVYWRDGQVVQRPNADIGVAVSVPGGLVTPVIPAADQLSLAEVAARLTQLAERARDNRLRPEDLGGKSLAISNLGMYAVDSFIAIIEQPAPMVLAVGRITERIVPVNGQAAIRPICTLTLSADHRVLDGVPAAQFLTRVVRLLEQPFGILGTV